MAFSLAQLNYDMTDWKHQPSSNHHTYYSYSHSERDTNWPQSPEGEYQAPYWHVPSNRQLWLLLDKRNQVGPGLNKTKQGS